MLSLLPPPVAATRSGPRLEVFLLRGEDDAALKERLDELVAERLDETARAFDLDRLSARETDGERLATLLSTPPLLGGVRVVVLEEVEAASAAVAGAIAGFLENPSSTTRLIALAAGGLTGKIWERFRALGHEETFEPPRSEAELAGRATRRVRRAGKEIDPEAASRLAGLNEHDPARLEVEVEKLLAHVGLRSRIEVADVEAVAVSSPGGNRYTFLHLTGMGRRDEALKELHRLLEEGESPIYLVTLLASHFMMLGGIRACEALGVRDPDAIGQALGKSAWQIGRKEPRIASAESPRQQARRFDRQGIDRWLAGLLELDLALKSSRLPAATLMEEWILRLMSAAPAAG